MLPVASPLHGILDIGMDRALQVAIEAHSGQLRRGSDAPYAVHPVQVALALARMGAASYVIQAGVLHDVVEDCDEWTAERLEAEFGSEVHAIVAELTEDKSKSWFERKQTGVDHVAHMGERALAVKAADKLHNLSSLLADLRAVDHPDEVFRHFTASGPETLAMSRCLVEALVRRLENDLARSLLETLEALEAHLAG